MIASARRVVVRPLLALAVAGVVAAGIWGLTAPRGAHQALPVAVGDTVAVPGGLVRVVRVTDLSAANLPTSGPGMNMPSHAAAPKAPDGLRRFAVEVMLYAEPSGSLRFDADDFGVERAGKHVAAPLAGFGNAVVPGGVALSRSLAFQVPKRAKQLVLRVRGADRAITLSLAPARPGGHAGHGR